MYKPVQISDGIYWIGVNDRRTHLFENIWPIPKGISYNSYFIDDEKTAISDTVEISRMNDFFEKIDMLLQGRKLDYLIVNHLEPDHAGAISNTLIRYPEVQIVGNKKTIKILSDLYGLEVNHLIINNKDTLSLGKHNLTFFLTPMLHWPETMMTWDQTSKILFSGDAFGSYGTLDGGIIDEELHFHFYEDEIRRYYSNIVGKYWNPVKKALEMLNDIDISHIASTHGPVWKRDIDKMTGYYKKWSSFEADPGAVIVFGSMYGHTEKMAEAIGRALNEQGIREVIIHDSSKTHLSYVISDIFKYRGLALGSSAYNGTIFPPMGHLLDKIVNTGVKNRILGIFGSATWGGGGVKAISEFAEKMDWETVGEPVQARGGPTNQDLEICESIASLLAGKLKANG